MENDKVKELVEKVFSLIDKAKHPEDIEDIIKHRDLEDFKTQLQKNAVKTATFPQINFQFTKDDVKVLEKYIKDGKFKIQENSEIKDPLSKLLYSLAWKNGDLGKIEHIYNGIVAGLNNPSENVKQAIVFHQFGKHLTNPKEQPIIDQHVIRAYAIYKKVGERNDFRQFEEITNKHNYIVNSYIEWIQTLTTKNNVENKTDFIYHIDRLLFSVGKTIKLKKMKK